MGGTPVEVRLKRLPHGVGLALPAYETEGAAGMDLRAALEAPITLKPQERRLIPTGLSLEIPAGFEAQVRPRSGLAHRQGLSVLNSPGTIDSDYRGEVQVILINLGTNAVEIARGERIAQIVVAPVARATLCETDRLDRSDRGTGGFGHTGRS